MPSSRDSVSKYSFSRFTLVFLGVVSFLIIGSAIAGILWGIRIREQKQEVVLKNTELTKKNTQLDNYMENYIERLHKMDQKIRQVFSLPQPEGIPEDSDSSTGLLGQGGFNRDLAGNPEKARSDWNMNFKPDNLDDVPLLIDKIKIVENSTKKIYEFAVSNEEKFDHMPSRNPIQVDKGKFWFASGFGWRRHPFTGKKDFHEGLDIACRKGIEVQAPADGEVSSIKRYTYLGKTVKIKHDSEYTTVYGHLSDYVDGLKVGKKIEQGDVIGYVGASGRTTGPHLHYEVQVNGKPKNPYGYILDLK